MMFIDAIDKFRHLVPGCPEPEAVDALRDAVIEFCRDSQSWVYWVEKASDALTFDSDAEAQAIPVGLFDAWVSGQQLDVIDLNDQEAPPEDRTVITFDRERLHDSIALVPAPALAVPVRLLVSWAPTPWASEFPDHIWFSRAEALKAGALMRLMGATGTTYANPPAASQYEATFRAAIGSASASAGINRRTHLQRLRVRPAE